MKIEDVHNLKIGSLVTPIYGYDKGKIHTVTKITKYVNPYRRSNIEFVIEAVPVNPEEIVSDWNDHGCRRCSNKGWKLI